MSQISFSAAEIGVLSQFNADAMPDAVRRSMDELTRVVTVLAEAKNVQDNAATERGNAWKAILDVTFAIADATAATPSIRELVFNSVMRDYVNAEKATANASLKAYASTGRNVLLKLLDVSHTREELADASYKDVRQWLSPPADADLSSKLNKLVENVRYIERQIAKAKKADNAEELLALLHSFADSTGGAAQQVRNQFKSEKDKNTTAATMARELHDLQQNAPSQPTNVETRAA